MKKRTLVGLFGLFTAVNSVAESKTLVYCSEAAPTTFSPTLAMDNATMDATAETMFDRLLSFKAGTTELMPSLAESWTISPDGKSYTFKLRQNVKFHSNQQFKPSRNFNADDVLFTFNRQWDKQNPYYKLANYEMFNAMGMADLIKSVEKIDDYTVRISLNQPSAPFLANLATSFMSVQSAEYADQLVRQNRLQDLERQPIGTGPFQFYGYQPNAEIRYIAFQQYWQGRAKLDRLVFSITPDASVRLARLKNGECDVMPYPNPTDIDDIKQDKALQLLAKPAMNVGYIALNMAKAPFDNVKVRQALNYAVNKKAIIDSVYQGLASQAKSPLPPVVWGYNEKLQDYEFNPEKAKALLKEVGLENGFETEIWAMPVSRAYNPNARRMAEMVQQDWAKIGVKAKIVSFEWGEYLNRMSKGEHFAGMAGWNGDNGDPDNFLAPALTCDTIASGENYAHFCNAEYDKLINQAAQEFDQTKRAALYKQAQQIFVEQAPWITIANSISYIPLSKKVSGYVPSAVGLHNFYSTDIQTDK
ncbi:MAG: ABC transporter substrate-binding protein [Pasteurellaceae bacterium]|nr:ABC transporter substrate-binding protein [Pasteurellaceae bacterium]